MRLRDTEWGHVFNASGARGFYGEGYWFHFFAKPLGMSYQGSTLVAKTTTFEPRVGNMALGPRVQPLDFLPDCIIVKPWKGVVLNAVGLSGPGAYGAIDLWKKYINPKRNRAFVASFMSVASTPAERAREARAFFAIFDPFVRNRGRMRTALQINFSCPNVGLDPTRLTDEVQEVLTDAAKLEIPILVKLNALVPVEAVKTIAAHPSCDAIVCSNTIPWGKLTERIDWKGLFGSNTSPLAKYGGGGLSGKPLLPIVADWIRDVRMAGVTTPIVGGGGILCRQDAERLLDVGADAIELGSISILRPWRVRGIVKYVNTRMSIQA